MKTYNVSRLPSMINIGYDGENNWRPQAFDCSALLASHPNGTISLWLLPHGETQAFPVALTRDGNLVVWTPLSEEMTAATGALQLVCTDGTDVGKSAVVLFSVDESILPGADHPAAVPSWATQTIERAEAAADRAEEAAESIDVEHLEQIISAAVEAYLVEHPIEAPVQSVNGKTGVVDLNAADVHALPESTVIPPAVTEQDVAEWGFTKNTGNYTKPSTGIPKTDLAQAVQTSLGKADTALQTAPVTSVNGKTGAVVLKTSDLQNDSGFQTAPFEIPITQSGDTFTTTATAADILANADNCVAVVGGTVRVSADYVGASGTTALLVFSFIDATSQTAPDEVFAVVVQNNSVTVSHASRDVKDLPAVTASDNGKSLVVENGVWGKGYQAARIPRVAMTSADTTPTLNPNTFYVFPEMASLTPTLNTPADATIVNEYHFMFTSGATATTLTLPASVLQPDGFAVEANHVYEVSIVENCMTAQGWAVSA